MTKAKEALDEFNSIEVHRPMPMSIDSANTIRRVLSIFDKIESGEMEREYIKKWGGSDTGYDECLNDLRRIE